MSEAVSTLTRADNGNADGSSLTLECGCLAPLFVLDECEVHADTIDDHFKLQVEAVQKHEQIRRETDGHTANEIPFPLPEPLNASYQGRLCKLLLPEYEKLGTWDIGILSATEALAVRRNMLLKTSCPPRDRYGINASVEHKEWYNIASTKEKERAVWGCFEASHFPMLHRFWNDDYRVLHATSLDPDLLRADIHENTVALNTSIDGDAAWEVTPMALLPQIPKETWEYNVTGGFCLRETNVTNGLKQVAPVDEWECAICLGDTRKGVVATGCAHVFHEGCILNWLGRSKRCPLCRARCREGPTVCNAPMDFDLVSWPMLPEGVVATDEMTRLQEECAAARLERQLSTQDMETRRQRLAARFGCQPPSASFFEEVRPDDATLIGPEAVATRLRCFREEVALEFARLDAAGQHFTTWPIDRRWPAMVSTDIDITKKRNQILERLQGRHLVRRHGFVKGLARYLLQRCYGDLVAA